VRRKALFIEQQTTDEGAWFAVAEALGGRTVAELKSTMDYREFVGWVVYLTNKADDVKHGR
jgi:hypothetical protein